MASLKGSVGKKGKNLPADVKLVQSLLNEFAKIAKFAKLKLDGLFGPKTQGAIVAFQKNVLKTAANGLIDAKGEAFKVLSGGAKKAAELANAGATTAKDAKKILEKETLKPAKALEPLIKFLETSAATMLKLIKVPMAFMEKVASLIRELSAFVAEKVIKGARKLMKVVFASIRNLAKVTKDLAGFLRNLIAAIVKGNLQFARNLLVHLKAGLASYISTVMQTLKDLAPVEEAIDALAAAYKVVGSFIPALKDAVKAATDLKVLRQTAQTALQQARNAERMLHKALESAFDSAEKAIAAG